MSATPTGNSAPYDVVVLGAGYAGLMAALRLCRPKPRLRIALVNAHDVFLERVRLQETIVTPIAPRIPSIADVVAKTAIEFIRGTVASIDPDRRRIWIMTDTQQRAIAFRQAVYALGSTIDVDAVPGVADHAYRLEAGEGPRSAAALRARLHASAGQPVRVVAVGGAETGIEAAGEIKAAWPRAEVSMVSRSQCGDFKGARVEAAVRTALTRLGVKLIDCETVTEVGPAEIITASGRSIACDICVWSGGLRAAPFARDAGLATNRQGRIRVDADLRSISHPQILAVGDAACPVVPTGAPYRLSAFAALASGAHAADVILAQRRERQVRPFSFSTFGQGVAVGRGGVGFLSYPDDRQRLFILEGRTARQVRDFFVWLVAAVLKVERRVPGFFFYPGRRRVSWHQANEAMQKLQTAQKAPA
jgi:NADH dehydrogenase FAD-containing subunit